MLFQYFLAVLDFVQESHRLSFDTLFIYVPNVVGRCNIAKHQSKQSFFSNCKPTSKPNPKISKFPYHSPNNFLHLHHIENQEQVCERMKGKSIVSSRKRLIQVYNQYCPRYQLILLCSKYHQRQIVLKIFPKQIDHL
jgi:hypothetical protein